ncbi:hypothetical protein [Aeromonas veronii]
MALHGQWRGLNLLYPMERLFEAYVARQLRRQLPLRSWPENSIER